MFGVTESEPQEPEESSQSSSAEGAASEHHEARNDTSELQTTDGDEETTDPVKTTGEDSLPEHVSYDADTECYVCDLCGSEYTASEERKASACCQFASKDDVFVAAKRARSTASTPSELFTRLGNITEHAESYGIKVTIQDFANCMNLLPSTGFIRQASA